MSSPLIVIAQDPVHLQGFLDGASDLQVKHGTNSLYDYGHSLEARHADLSQPSETIRVDLADFASGGYDWQITASHVVAGNTIAWSRDTSEAYCEFGAMTDALEVEVRATSNASPPTTETRTIWIKTRPVDGLPDRT
ncbi:hypothetical protein [Paraliomyxa miuraensis]|uniref:hypothetical protein n=1 Tax=Paraliomyxa miuraensis TaxID=376150 RepID=UPI002251AF5E|nr:hypothetical protein [Paraliomyxa miuraensis]MCX4243943.1 hypothetical protein [Paraliomyxa miuraensis]